MGLNPFYKKKLMAFQQQTYHSPIYRNFRAIDGSEHRRIVRFYERNEKSILLLDFEEYFDLLVTYTKALFEISEYRKHLLMADVVIKTSILQNITHVRGEEVYRSALFQKAASHYNLNEYPNASHILGELIKMNPHDPLSIRFLGRVLRDDKPPYIRHTRAVSVFLFLMSAIMICIQVLIVKHFYVIYDPLIEISRNSIFGLGVLTLMGAEIGHRWRVHVFVRELVSSIKVKKSNSEMT